MAATVFGLFIVIALTAGLVFHIVTVALPKIVDERLGDVPLILVGGLATADVHVRRARATRDGASGREIPAAHPVRRGRAPAVRRRAVDGLCDRHRRILFALAVAIAAIYAQVTVNDMVIARYTADAWRGRVYAVRYFLTFLVSGAAVSLIALLHSRGGFDLVLAVTAVDRARLRRSRPR